MGNFIRVLVCATILLAATAHRAAAQIEEHLGPVAGAVTLGVNGNWEARLQDGWFNLFNRGEPGGVQYYFATQPQLGSGERSMKLTTLLRGSGGEPAFSGIFFNRKAENEYMAFVISDDGSVSIIIRSPDGFDRNAAQNLKARLDGSDVLEIRERPDGAVLFLNGEKAFEISAGQGLVPTYGIIAIGEGRFAFSRLDIETKANAPFPRPGGDSGGEEQPFPGPDTGPAPAPAPAPTTSPAPAPAPAPAPSPKAEVSPQDLYVAKVLMGTTLGVFFHEFGHALIGETGLPATGPEEDTADGFSAFVLGATVEDGGFADPAEEDFAEGIAEYASLYWYYSGVFKAQAGQGAPWQAEHAPDLKRFRNSFCILYGSNPARYEDIATKTKLEPRTKERCKMEFRKRYAAWEAILATVSRNLGPDMPGNYPADAPGGRIIVNLQPSQSETGKVVYRILKASNMMDDMMREMERIFVLPRDLQIEFRDCEEVNAWYDPSEGKVTMCYSIIEATSQLIFQAEGAGPAAGGGRTGGGQSADPEAFLVGTWQTTIQGANGPLSFSVTYMPDKQYRAEYDTPLGPVQVLGTWQASMSGENTILLSSTPVQWTPTQFCDANGFCQPNEQFPQQVLVQVTGADTVSAEGISWQRVR